MKIQTAVEKVLPYFRMDVFLWKDMLRAFLRKSEVAFVVDSIKPYNKALASVRLRCYNIIKYLNGIGIKTELYRPERQYKLVIFTKTSSTQAVTIAEVLKKKGTPIIYDAFCESFENDNYKKEIDNILKITSLAQCIIVCSDEQKKLFLEKHSYVKVIPEGIDDELLKWSKKHCYNKKISLVYCGYAQKAKDTLYIKNVLEQVMKTKKCQLIYICERDPQIEDLNYRYIRYNQRHISKQLCYGDIMIAPRSMTNIEKQANSFTKVALPMAVGLPVVASPVPSYIGSPVLLCYNDKEWLCTLEKLIDDCQLRIEKAREGKEYIKDNYLLSDIGKKYVSIIELYM